jgi:hypothetical protein
VVPPLGVPQMAMTTREQDREHVVSPGPLGNGPRAGSTVVPPSIKAVVPRSAGCWGVESQRAWVKLGEEPRIVGRALPLWRKCIVSHRLSSCLFGRSWPRRLTYLNATSPKGA